MMNQEVIRKMRMAKKYQREAMLELIPEEIRENVQNIEKEMRQIMMKCFMNTGTELMQAFMDDHPVQEAEEDSEKPGTVKKVEIG